MKSWTLVLLDTVLLALSVEASGRKLLTSRSGPEAAVKKPEPDTQTEVVDQAKQPVAEDKKGDDQAQGKEGGEKTEDPTQENTGKTVDTVKKEEPKAPGEGQGGSEQPYKIYCVGALHKLQKADQLMQKALDKNAEYKARRIAGIYIPGFFVEAQKEIILYSTELGISINAADTELPENEKQNLLDFKAALYTPCPDARILNENNIDAVDCDGSYMPLDQSVLADKLSKMLTNVTALCGELENKQANGEQPSLAIYCQSALHKLQAAKLKLEVPNKEASVKLLQGAISDGEFYDIAAGNKDVSEFYKALKETCVDPKYNKDKIKCDGQEVADFAGKLDTILGTVEEVCKKAESK